MALLWIDSLQMVMYFVEYTYNVHNETNQCHVSHSTCRYQTNQSVPINYFPAILKIL
jgi:hypothetical protein